MRGRARAGGGGVAEGVSKEEGRVTACERSDRVKKESVQKRGGLAHIYVFLLSFSPLLSTNRPVTSTIAPKELFKIEYIDTSAVERGSLAAGG